jgi:hypothetical protein
LIVSGKASMILWGILTPSGVNVKEIEWQIMTDTGKNGKLKTPCPSLHVLFERKNTAKRLVLLVLIRLVVQPFWGYSWSKRSMNWRSSNWRQFSLHWLSATYLTAIEVQDLQGSH